MKKILLIAILLFTKSIFATDFYDITQINSVELTFTQSNWDYLLDNLYAAGNEDRLLATVVINGVQFDSVGVRYKGNSTYSANRTKNPLNIKLDYVIDNQNYEGYGTLKLSNVYNDPSFVREVLGYEIARNYLPSSKANFANVSINGTLIGLYTSVQSVDKFFLANHYFSNDFPFFKGETSGGASTGTVWDYLGSDSSLYSGYYELRSDYGWNDLVDFLDTVNNNNSYIENVLNIDRHLWMLAFDNLCVNLDAPINYGHNYYLYQDASDRFSPVIWDLNENFGIFGRLMNGSNLSTSQKQQLDPFLNENSSSYPIISKVLSVPIYKKMYVAHMKTIIEEYFSNGLYTQRANAIQAIIATDVQNDNNKFYTYSEFSNNVTSSVGMGPQAKIGISQLMDSRVTYLLSQTEFQATQPDISNIVSPSTASPNTTINFTADITNATTAYLAYRDIGSGKFQTVTLYDDGNHNDGTAGDGTYGNSITANSIDIEYYILAENNDAVKFSPQRAEYELYSIAITGDVVINEFMADNNATQADPNGEFDDWIELYNNTNAAVSLNGYYLSDNSGDPTQWAFPDTSIAANGYLIIWADKDTTQTGIHANFKLSTSGEEVILTDASGSTLDQITFGAQSTDSSYARFPNGTGSFIIMPPTFAAENIYVAITVDVVINEFMADNDTTQADQDGDFDDWIELYNNSNSIVSLNGYYLSDYSSNPTQWAFPDTSIAANSYLIIWADKDTTQTGLHANFKLSTSGEEIIFTDNSLNTVDQIIFGTQSTDSSYARFPNGTGSFIIMPPTFEAENIFGTIASDIVINEFMADNDAIQTDQDGEFDDWIELYNKSNTAVSLNGYYLSDDSSDPTQWAFPDTSIAANGYLIIWADDDAQTGLHANFKLSTSGEEVIFSNASLATVDQITFGAQSTDSSYARFPNGTGSFIIMPPTFAAENIYDPSGIDELTNNDSYLSQNYPNPFSNTTKIDFYIPTSGYVDLSVYNIAGEKVRTLVNSNLSQGEHTIDWNGYNNSNNEIENGIYLYMLTVDNKSYVLKMVKIN